jgi:hypothetical protein
MLKDKLLTPDNRPNLIRDCGRMLDEEVDRKSGFSGLAVKAAFKMVKAVKPGFIQSVIDALLDDWVAKLEGHFERWQSGPPGRTFGTFVAADATAVAEKLLEVTDARAHKIDNRGVAKAYSALRPSAKDHTSQAVPALGRVVDRYL